MDDRGDAGNGAEEATERSPVLDAPPRDGDVAGAIRKNAKRARLIGAGAFVVVAFLVWGVWATWLDDDAPRRGEDTAPSSSSGYDALEATSSEYTGEVDGETGDAEAGDGDSAAGDGDTTADTGQDGTGSADWVDAGMVAYRIGGQVWVSAEDGSDPRYVADSAEGAYALSPDGTAVAVVDSSDGVLRIVEAGSGSYVRVLAGDPPDAAQPAASWRGSLAWAPDSSAIAFVVTERPRELWLADREGTTVSRLALGASPRFAPDSGVLGFVSDEEDPAFGRVAAGDAPDLLEAPARIADLAWAGDRLYFSLQVAPGQDAQIRAADMDDAVDGDGDGVPEIGGEVLVPGPHGVGFMVGYTSLLLSPDGGWLAYTASGDDGFSRLYVVRTAGGTPRELSIRRDSYPLRWSSDGAYLLFIEGNPWQGEETRLMRVRPDGTGRQTLVDGAGL